MLVGLIHTHKGLGYLLVLVAVIGVGLAAAGLAGGPKPGLLRAGQVVTRRLGPALMGINALFGLALWFLVGWGLMTWWTWAGVFALAAHGMLGGRGHKPTFVALDAGEPVAGRWLALAVVDLAIVLAAFGAMHMGKAG